MRNPESAQSQPHLSQRLDDARLSFRQIRRGLYKPFRRPQKFTVTYRPSSSEENPDRHIVLRAPEESISWSVSSATGVSPAMDGVAEKRFTKPRNSAPIAAIFVHAGAGYHSTTNEHIHLGACKDAARFAMQILKNGGTAVDAVEAAVKVLEDKEITNAGYGSNLTIEGVVECDATVVDHLGRSGACGATAKVKNPINLARLILEHSNRPLSLRRVPPNLLVGEGAVDFAWENGIPIVPHDAIVSKNARDRYVRWREDLKRAGGARLTPDTTSNSESAEEMELDLTYEERVRKTQRTEHAHALLSGTWNEGPPDSPQARSPAPNDLRFPADAGPEIPSRTDNSFTSSLSARPGLLCQSNPSRLSYVSHTKRPRTGANRTTETVTHRAHSLLGSRSHIEGSLKTSPDTTLAMEELRPLAERKRERESSDGTASPTFLSEMGESRRFSPPEEFPVVGITLIANSDEINIDEDDDIITDTVGAIAIDLNGNIAAASSSGGIGMKHRGRVGPAALVGVGTAVIPTDPHDPNNITVAAVTSGTGEHMATTMASQKCAERLFYGTRRGYSGADISACEEEAMESFIIYDFMGHPGVKKSHSAGAIGIMAVKKTPEGYFFHFAHNTDSFALCSFASNEKEAKCVMSRMGNHGAVVQGGRKIRIE